MSEPIIKMVNIEKHFDRQLRFRIIGIGHDVLWFNRRLLLRDP